MESSPRRLFTEFVAEVTEIWRACWTDEQELHMATRSTLYEGYVTLGVRINRPDALAEFRRRVGHYKTQVYIDALWTQVQIETPGWKAIDDQVQEARRQAVADFRAKFGLNRERTRARAAASRQAYRNRPAEPADAELGQRMDDLELE